MRRRAPNQRRRLHPLVIAAIMILVPAFVTYYAFSKQLPFSSPYTDYAIVPNSLNVRGGDPVRIAGIDVGSVEGVSPHGSATKISFSLDSGALPIHTDAAVTVRDRLFLEGSYYLDLSPGSPSAPAAPEGFTIREPSTQTPVQFFQVLSTFDVAARTNLKNLLDTSNVAFSPRSGRPLSDSGAGALKQAIPQLTPLMQDVAIDSRALTGTHPGDLENLLASSAGVFGTLERNSSRLVDLVDGLDAVSGALAASDGALGQSIAGLDATLRAAPSSLAAVDRALPPLARLASALTPTLRASPPIVRSVSSAVQEVTQAVAPNVRGALLSSLRTTLATFPSVLTQVADVFPGTKSVSDCLRTHVIPILEEQVPDGALSTNEPVWKDFVHMLPSLASASGQFDGNGPYIRVLLGAGSQSLQVGTLGSLPGIGQLVGTSPGGSPIQGSTPKWVGTLTPSAFRPDVSCASDPLPSLASQAAAPDLRRADDPSAGLHVTPSVLRRALSLAAGHQVRRLP